MRVDAFDFDLPPERIALRPCEPRDAARLLVVRPKLPLDDRDVRDLPKLLQPGDALVFNDTKVIPAQLFGLRGAARIGVTLHKRVDAHHWLAFIKNAKRLSVGDDISFVDVLRARVVEKHDDGQVLLWFDTSGPVESALAIAGVTPLPPYIANRRPADERDLRDYQTVYARVDGSVAAPTAGLHFTPELLATLAARGINTITLTLHVGAGTFLPVKAAQTADHKMHSEWGEITTDAASQLNAIRAKGGRIVAVGTTSLRLLESAAGDDGTIHAFSGDTDIFITPGYRFKAVDILMTNFHLPRSTLFMLVSAFCGLDVMRAAYAHAIENAYRFYSYGDSSLLFRT